MHIMRLRRAQPDHLQSLAGGLIRYRPVPKAQLSSKLFLFLF